MPRPRLNLYDLTREQLRVQLVRWDLKPVHVARLWNYLYIELAASLDAMPELPPQLRARLAAETHLGVLPTALETKSGDGFTHKYLLALSDAERIETVLMRFTGRVTACVSSQVGCAMGCVFCATGQMGYTRHLTPGEIVAQVVHVARALRSASPPAPVSPDSATCHLIGDKWAETGAGSRARRSDAGDGVSRLSAEIPAGSGHLLSDKLAAPGGRAIARSGTATCGGPDVPAGVPREERHLLSDKGPGADAGPVTLAAAPARLRNVVLMGMGEPLHNYDAVMTAIEILRDETGLALGAERITLSTVGVVPGILRLAAERRPLHLAVSLHAATQEERAALVPAARKWPLDELMAACRTYSETTGRRIFYEWTLIEGKNDSEAHARSVGALLQGLPAQVNLIPLNPTSGYAGAPTRSDAAKRFQKILADEFKLPSTVRQRRGIDIAAGCGQLAVAETGVT